MMPQLDQGPHEVILNGARLAYHVHGEGPLLVALPGGPGFSHRYLRAPLVEANAKVVYVDPIGCGDSDRLADPNQYGRARDVADLEELRKHLGLDQLAIMGHSAGGFIAQQYALAHRTRVAKLVLYDTTPTNGADFGASLAAELKARSHEPWFPAAEAARQALFSGQVSEANIRDVTRALWPLYTFEPSEAIGRRLAETGDFSLDRGMKAPPVPFDFHAELTSLDVPALVIVGARDYICAPVLAEMLHRALTRSMLVTMTRSGHFAHLEEPVQFAATVLAFLRDR